MGGYVDDVNVNPGHDYGSTVGSFVNAPQWNEGISSWAAAFIALAVLIVAFLVLRKI